MMMLLGDGVVAACLLKETKATGEGWMVITTAWGFAVLCGIFTANLFGESRCPPQPRHHRGLRRDARRFFQAVAVRGRADCGEFHGRGRGLAVLPAAVESDGRSSGEARGVLHGTGDPVVWCKISSPRWWVPSSWSSWSAHSARSWS